MKLLLVLSPGVLAHPEPPEDLTEMLAGAGVVLLGRATCHSMVRQVHALAPEQTLIHAPSPTPDLVAALQAWSGTPPCAVSLISAPLRRDRHEELVALGVHAWLSVDAIDAAGLEALLGRAQARWQREALLRDQLGELHTRLDERKWIDRAKGVLMLARGIGEDEAFGLLRSAAMHANLRLGDVSRSVIETKQWADAVNRAGQLRMLSQRLVRLAAQLVAGIEPRRSRTLRAETTERVQSSLDYLGTLALSGTAATALAGARSAWEILARAQLERLSPKTLADIDAEAEVLLAAADVLTETLEAAGSRRALRIVNICGRQRMRVQRLAKEALLASMSLARASGVRLESIMDEFETALLELERTPLSSPDIRTALAAARADWLRLVRAVNAADSAEGRAGLVRSSDALVETFEHLTASYEQSLQVIMS